MIIRETNQMNEDALPISTIAVIGLGKLGSPIAACLAARGGYCVIGVDTDARKVDALNAGQPPVNETGLADLMAQVSGRANLSATTDIERAVLESDATFIMVPTPSDADGQFSLAFVLPACERIGRALCRKSQERTSFTRRRRHLISLCSTVMPGHTAGPIRTMLEQSSGLAVGVEIGLCYSPEFIALGSVIRDYLNPDFVLIGESDEMAGSALAKVYERTCQRPPRVARMTFVNAELTKIGINSFITTKITYANMMANICQHTPGADVDVVTQALGLDSRIGAKYLRGAVGFGGPCFPRDNVALARAAQLVGAQAQLATAVDRVNEQEVMRLADLVEANLPSRADSVVVGVLGLSYKPDTDVIERSQGMLLVQELRRRRLAVACHDPMAMENARSALKSGDVLFCQTLTDIAAHAQVFVITTAWAEYVEGLPEALRHATHHSDDESAARPVIIDCWRCISRRAVCAFADYVAVGIGPRCAINETPQVVTDDQPSVVVEESPGTVARKIGDNAGSGRRTRRKAPVSRVA